MRQKELGRRSTELEAHMLAQRNAERDGKPVASTQPKATADVTRAQDDCGAATDDSAELGALRKRIPQLKNENERLRQQVAILNTSLARTERSSMDSVREQLHTFFKRTATSSAISDSGTA
jgi:hypothetical protein